MVWLLFLEGVSTFFMNSCICEYKLQHAQWPERWPSNVFLNDQHVGKT